MTKILYIDSKNKEHVISEMSTIHLTNALNKLKRNMDQGILDPTIKNLELRDEMEKELKTREDQVEKLPKVNFPGKRNSQREINDEF